MSRDMWSRISSGGNGYTPQEVANELYRHTPARPHRQNCDERINYGRRAVWYAFGTAGDIDIANIRPTAEQIQNLVREAKNMEGEKTAKASLYFACAEAIFFD